MTANEDLAYRIIAHQQPHGRPTTSYCYSSPELNEAAMERDRQYDAAQIRPMIQDYHARLLSRVRELEGALAPFASIGIEYWPKERVYFDVSMRRDMIESARKTLNQKETK